MQWIISIIIGLLGGVATGVQVPFAGIMGQKVGDAGSVLFTYIGGLTLITCVVLVTGQYTLGNWREIPWYAFLTGPLGVIIVGSFSYCAPRIGITVTTMLHIMAWLTVGALIDHFGWFGVTTRLMDTTRLLWLVALAIGAWLVIR